MSRIHFKSISTLIAATALVAAMSAQAQTQAQTIVVDGVRYQAVGPAPQPFPAVVVQAPIQAPVVLSTQVQAPTPVQFQGNYDVQSVHPSQVIVPLVMTAMGAWAIHQWFRGDRPQIVNRQGHGHRPVHHTGPAPVVVAPVVTYPQPGGHHGGYHR